MRKIILGIVLLALSSSAAYATSASGAKIRYKKEDKVFYNSEIRIIDFIDGKGNVVLRGSGFGGKKEFVTVDDLAKVKKCHGRSFCKGKRVLYSGSVFRILFAYGEDYVALNNIDSGGYKKYLSVEDIYPIYDSRSGYKKLENVLYDRSFRKVEFLYKKRTSAGNTETWAALMSNNDHNRSFAPIDDISKIKKCYKGFCRRDKVLYDGAIRVIEAVDNSGRVVLRADSDHDKSFTDNSELSMYKKCKGLCLIFGPISPAYEIGESEWDNSDYY